MNKKTVKSKGCESSNLCWTKSDDSATAWPTTVSAEWGIWRALARAELGHSASFQQRNVFFMTVSKSTALLRVVHPLYGFNCCQTCTDVRARFFPTSLVVRARDWESGSLKDTDETSLLRGGWGAGWLPQNQGSGDSDFFAFSPLMLKTCPFLHLATAIRNSDS